MADVLPALPEDDLTRVLCVVAHPDDLEYGASCAVARWTAHGVDVAYLLLTHGEAGMDASPPAETGPLRAREQVAAAAEVGVHEVELLDHPDGVLEPGLALRRDVAAAVRRYRPDAVLTMTWEAEVGWGLNQADHRAAGLATLDGVRDAGNRWVFTDLLDEGLEPWGARRLLVHGHTRPTHAVDVTGEPLRRGVASLQAHASYLAGLPWHPDPAEMVPAMAAEGGRAAGVEHAVLLRAYDL
ncbi:PIG-L deacetylase family protein [Cellulomonas shaoxiangyii]|uniref:PIG-L family deacetylase n=1 Tax=Cellulomonas shaoxiangyii TaxID=2566013 RepID=A0A4P7SG02_9CELL|nr:PIG-L deacetylase family protein [Cellulomonas shaoxiangyii]QCB92508.1 PIG-L family deacetylase [Cellulomonas shaoxiangyii]TGY83401.1 PIG-L family deacetylase [Cellulomonas shaoxiangyii]